MNVFETHSKIVDDYASYIKSFINISDEQIEKKVRDELEAGSKDTRAGGVEKV